MAQSTVNLFFACDERYLPLFGVTITSIKNHRDPNRRYHTVVLHTDITRREQKRVRDAFAERGFSITFRCVKREVTALRDALHTRDYYTNATYYRLFIPALYPSMKRALYLDSDILLRADVAALFDTPLGDALAAAVPDGFVDLVPALRRYVENRVGASEGMPYFNAGVLLMNLAEMRKIRFGERFVSLLRAVRFRVAQDQDYLNILCRGRVRFLPERWNYMPFRYGEEEPSLVHFNLDNKPWQRDGVPYGEEFWACADTTPYAALLRERRAAYSEADVERAAAQTEALIAMAVAEGEDAAACARVAERVRLVMDPADHAEKKADATAFRMRRGTGLYLGARTPKAEGQVL